MATILIIDDNETIRIGIKQIVEKMGHAVLAAASGAEGVAQMKKREVDFLITDLKMEGMDGVAVLKAAAEIDPDCPAMIITAFGTVETGSRGGCAFSVVLPVDQDAADGNNSDH